MLTAEEQRKACQIGEQVARERGYKVSGKVTIGRLPTEQCAVVVVVTPAHRGSLVCHVHVVLEIQQKKSGRVLHTVHVHEGDGSDEMIAPASLYCLDCDEYHFYERYYDDPGDEVGLEEHECEGGSFWDDDGKGGFTACTRTDTQWYEFWMTGSAGWFCPTHWPYEDDMMAIRRARERAEKRSAEQA